MWGETADLRKRRLTLTISIHSPRVGRDLTFNKCPIRAVLFQSTLPVWGETGSMADIIQYAALFQSTLPVWGETILQGLYKDIQRDFNPLSPCGERRNAYPIDDVREIISIHSPRVGRDGARGSSSRMVCEFQSTLPVWGETTCLYW